MATPAAMSISPKRIPVTSNQANVTASLNILVAAIRKVGVDPGKVAADLPTVKDYPGVAGNTTIDANGDAVKAVMVKTIRNGKFVVYSSQ